MNHVVTSDRLVGSIRRFGSYGVLYEVLKEIDEKSARIRVLETGEETAYPIKDIATDPVE